MKNGFKYYSITYGHIIASWHLIYLAQTYKGISVANAISITEKSGKLGGTVPAKQGLKLCSDYGLLSFHREELHVTDISENTILPNCQSEDINTNALRSMLRHILSFHNFEWLILFDSDPIIFRDSLFANDPEWANLLDNAKLFDFDQEDVNIWWDKVLAKYEDNKEKQKKAIGDIGEKLTYHFELQRIDLNGFIPSKNFVKWAARISDRFGFDVLSVRGDHFLSSYRADDKIQIEVKSSDANNLERFRFFISKPEWTKAMENINSYFFFFWAGINVNTETAESGPYVIPAREFIESIPLDRSKLMEWSECRCVLDISKFTKLV